MILGYYLGIFSMIVLLKRQIISEYNKTELKSLYKRIIKFEDDTGNHSRFSWILLLIVFLKEKNRANQKLVRYYEQ